MSRTPTLVTIAGTGRIGFSGDGGLARDAELNRPYGLDVDTEGRLYIADYFNSCVRRVERDGTIRTVAGAGGRAGFGGDGGPATAALLNGPMSVATCADGSWLIADRNNNRIRSVDPAGHITTVAGPAGQHGTRRGTTAGIRAPSATAALPNDGGLLIVEADDARVWRMGPDGTLTTIAGPGTRGFGVDGSLARTSQLYQPAAVLIAPGGIYIADAAANRVWRVDPDGLLHAFAGNGARGSNGDGGLATAAELSAPTGLAMASDGSVYIAEFGGHRVRKVDAWRVITTIVGTGVEGRSEDGTPASAARLSRPRDVALAGDVTLFFSDSENSRVCALNLGNG